MDVRKKLVELVGTALDGTLLNITDSVVDCVVDALIANCVTVQEWKPISEPPKEKGTYLVCTDNGGVLLGHWYGTAWNAGGGAKSTLRIG